MRQESSSWSANRRSVGAQQRPARDQPPTHAGAHDAVASDEGARVEVDHRGPWLARRHAALDRPCRAMFALLIALFANAVAMASPFPFAPFLVLHYGLTDDRAEIGYYGGFILSAFMLGRAMSSYHLGLLSDKHGRVLVIEIGLLFEMPDRQAAELRPFHLSPATRAPWTGITRATP